MRNLPLFLFFILSSFVYSQTSYEKYAKDLRSFDEHLNNAKELKKLKGLDGYIEMAYLEVLKAIRFNRESSEAYSIKGELNFWNGDYESAMEDLNHSIRLGSKNGCTYLYRAMSRINGCDFSMEDAPKFCADLMTAKALGGCYDNQAALDAYLNSWCE